MVCFITADFETTLLLLFFSSLHTKRTGLILSLGTYFNLWGVLNNTLEMGLNFATMATDNIEIWIKAGYEIFALTGEIGLKIEPLAKKVGINKSSFYHHFGDLELFIEFLLKYHIEQAFIIADKERNAKNIDPDLIEIVVEHRIDLLFNRQLRIHQNIELFAKTLLQSNRVVGEAFITIWANELNLPLTQKQIAGIFTLALENFFLQININNLNHNWLSAYFANLKAIAGNFV